MSFHLNYLTMLVKKWLVDTNFKKKKWCREHVRIFLWLDEHMEKTRWCSDNFPVFYLVYLVFKKNWH